LKSKITNRFPNRLALLHWHRRCKMVVTTHFPTTIAPIGATWILNKYNSQSTSRQCTCCPYWAITQACPIVTNMLPLRGKLNRPDQCYQIPNKKSPMAMELFKFICCHQKTITGKSGCNPK